MALIIKVGPRKPERRLLRLVAEGLRRGMTVAYPTETSYGLGCDATNARAVRKLYAMKRRSSKPMPVIVPDIRTMARYGRLDGRVRALARRFMPGPLSIIVKKRKTIPDVLNPRNICFRISSNAVAHALASALGRPLVSTSANVSGAEPIYKIFAVKKTFGRKVDIIIDAGNLRKCRPSTLLDMTGEPRVVRAGPIPSSKVLKYALGRG